MKQSGMRNEGRWDAGAYITCGDGIKADFLPVSRCFKSSTETSALSFLRPVTLRLYQFIHYEQLSNEKRNVIETKKKNPNGIGC